MSAVKVGSVIAEELRKVILDKHGLTSSAGSTHDVYYKEISGRKNVEFNIYIYVHKKKGAQKKEILSVCLSVIIQFLEIDSFRSLRLSEKAELILIFFLLMQWKVSN